MNRKLKKLFIAGAYKSFGNLARFFIRMFAGILFLQFGIRQIASFDMYASVFPSILGMSPVVTLALMITVELLFSTLIIFGFLTRIAAVPPLISMIIAEYYLVSEQIVVYPVLEAVNLSQSAVFTGMQLGYVPIMFVGMFFFIVLAGPGKISVDYLVMLYFGNKNNLNELRNI